MERTASPSGHVGWIVSMRTLACLAVVLLHAASENGLELANAAV